MQDFLQNNLKLCIPPRKTSGREDLGLSELKLCFQDGKLSLIDQNKSQDALRLGNFCALLQLTAEKHSIPNCEFILNLYEGVYEDGMASRLAYTAKPNSGHFLIPDSHNFATVQKIDSLERADIPFAQKKKNACFYGSDTGNRRKDGWTMRSLVSYTYKDSPLVTSKLTSLDADIGRLNFDPQTIYDSPKDLAEQLQSQVILNINGNSTSWERLLWAMASNSLCVFIKPFDGEEMYSWYYPLLEATGCVPMVEYDRLETFMQNDFSAEFWQEKIKNQKIFAKFVGSLDVQALFLAKVLEFYVRA